MSNDVRVTSDLSQLIVFVLTGQVSGSAASCGIFFFLLLTCAEHVQVGGVGGKKIVEESPILLLTSVIEIES